MKLMPSYAASPRLGVSVSVAVSVPVSLQLGGSTAPLCCCGQPAKHSSLIGNLCFCGRVACQTAPHPEHPCRGIPSISIQHIHPSGRPAQAEVSFSLAYVSPASGIFSRLAHMAPPSLPPSPPTDQVSSFSRPHCLQSANKVLNFK